MVFPTTEERCVRISGVLKEILYLKQDVLRFVFPRAGMSCFPVFEGNQVLCILREAWLLPIPTRKSPCCIYDSISFGNT